MATNTTLLYFAYGSNMATERLGERISTAKKIATAKLVQHRLTFAKKGFDGSGKCDVEENDDPESRVYGVVYEIPADAKAILDRFEGDRYTSKTVSLKTTQGQQLEAFCYSVEDKERYTNSALKPYQWYHHHVLFGAQQADLPQSYIAALKKIDAIQDGDKDRAAREMAIYK